MMKRIFAAVLLAAGFTGMAGETVFDKPGDCIFEGGRPAPFADGVYNLSGNFHFLTKKVFNAEPGKKYKLSAEVRSDDVATRHSTTMAVIFVDEKGKWIWTREYTPAPNGMTTLAKAVAAKDTTVTIKAPANFKQNRNSTYALAFNAKEDLSDLPNKQVTGRIKEIKADGDTLILTLPKPVLAEFAAGTPVRLHLDNSFWTPCPKGTYYHWLNKEWRTITGDFTVPQGIKRFQLAFIYYNKRAWQLRNFKLIEE